MAKPVHSMIRVFDEAKSLDFYARAFGLKVADHLKFADFALIYLRHPSSPFEVELTVHTRWAMATAISPSSSTMSMPNMRVSRTNVCRQDRCATSSTMAGRSRASSSSPIPMVTKSRLSSGVGASANRNQQAFQGGHK